MLRAALSVFVLLWLTGCASYSAKIRNARNYFEVGQYETAANEFTKLADKKDNDELLYLMELGSVYHTAGRYADAVKVFRRAADLAEIKDYTSLGAEAASVLLNDDLLQYKGEDFEKILIHVYLALDYTALKQWDDALVECRKVNHILDRMISEGKMPYQHNAFAKYLAAVLFESQKDYNAAFVDYRTLLKWAPTFPYLGTPLKRVADKLQASQELSEYMQKFPGRDFRMSKNDGEVIVVVEQGKAPVKVPSAAFHLVPSFVKRPGAASRFELRLDQKKTTFEAFTLFDIESTAIKELEGKVAGIFAKKMAGFVAKQVVADQVAKQTKSKGWGALTAIVLHGTDQADLRSWTSLPAKLALVRAVVPAGRHDLSLDMVTTYGQKVPVQRWEGVEVKAGEKAFLIYRSKD